jgi:hypothetical protein
MESNVHLRSFHDYCLALCLILGALVPASGKLSQLLVI